MFCYACAPVSVIFRRPLGYKPKKKLRSWFRICSSCEATKSLQKPDQVTLMVPLRILESNIFAKERPSTAFSRRFIFYRRGLPGDEIPGQISRKILDRPYSHSPFQLNGKGYTSADRSPLHSPHDKSEIHKGNLMYHPQEESVCSPARRLS